MITSKKSRACVKALISTVRMQNYWENKSVNNVTSTSQLILIRHVTFAIILYFRKNSSCSLACMRSIVNVSWISFLMIINLSIQMLNTSSSNWRCIMVRSTLSKLDQFYMKHLWTRTINPQVLCLEMRQITIDSLVPLIRRRAQVSCLTLKISSDLFHTKVESVLAASVIRTMRLLRTSISKVLETFTTVLMIYLKKNASSAEACSLIWSIVVS